MDGEQNEPRGQEKDSPRPWTTVVAETRKAGGRIGELAYQLVVIIAEAVFLLISSWVARAVAAWSPADDLEGVDRIAVVWTQIVLAVGPPMWLTFHLVRDVLVLFRKVFKK